jgi:hypothetical protein
LKGREWDAFGQFFASKPNDVLQKDDLQLPVAPSSKDGGHAVVLMKIDPEYLMFMNSWGNAWADTGFFRVRDQSVLNLKFYDVYWTLNDLKESEIKAYDDHCKTVANDVLKHVPDSVKKLPFECPKCHVSSPAGTFEGHLSRAICPECRQDFAPALLGFLPKAWN